MSDAKNKLARAMTTISRLKEEGQVIARRSINSAAGYGASLATGYVRGRWGKGASRKVYLPGTQVEADTLLGIGATLVGTMGLAGDYSDLAVSIGTAVGGYGVARDLEEKVAADTSAKAAASGSR